MSTQDPIEQNITGVRQLVGSGINKISSGASNNPEGVQGTLIDELDLSTPDAELLDIAKTIEADYAPYEAKIRPKQNANRQYYLGRQNEGSSIVDEAVSANLIFEAVETFLPAALAKNPEPVVWSDDTKEGQALADDTKTMLQYHADVLVLRRKLAKMVREWSFDYLGAIKHGWDARIEDITSDVRDVKDFIFDKDGYIDEYGDYIGILGERMKVTADELVKMFPKSKSLVTILVDGMMGTKVTYTEWWSDEYCFYTFKGFILKKLKNPHFNYAKEVVDYDIDGNETKVSEPGKNHFARAKKPYTFLAVFTSGKQPHDVTSLIEQNIPNQRRITKRTEQLDYNLSRANNSDVFSEDNFNQETAKQAAVGMTKGHPILIPKGKPIGEALARLTAPSVGAEFFRELENSKQDLRSIFGTQGISSQAPTENTTARGMILNQQFDNTRIGGGIGDAIEQVADNIFNYWTQLYHVYYDVPHMASIMGQLRAVEYTEMHSQGFDKKLVVSVSADSMKSHDEITEMNQALSLWQAGAIDPKTLLTRLNFPDPQTTAESTVLWLIDKNLYLQMNFPELAQKIAMLQAGQPQPGQAPVQPGQPGQVNINPIAETPDTSMATDPASAALANVKI
jgi:hypothetical protein